MTTSAHLDLLKMKHARLLSEHRTLAETAAHQTAHSDGWLCDYEDWMRETTKKAQAVELEIAELQK